MRNFIQTGDVLDHKPVAAVASGAVVVIGKRVGVAVADIAANDIGPVRVKGVVELACVSTALAQGDLLYWDATNARLTGTATDNTLAGYAASASANGVSTIWLHLNG